MAAVLLHYMVLQQFVNLQYIRTSIWSDNTPTVAWTKRMADHSQAPTAGWLLCGLAAVQRSVQAGPLTLGSIAGIDNDMANVASRSFDIQCDTAFLAHFTTPAFPSAVTILAPHAQVDLARDLHAGWQAIAAATVDDHLQAKNWDSWMEFCSATRPAPAQLYKAAPTTITHWFC
jgi:hypothetical protein